MKKWVKGMLIFVGILLVVGIGSLVAAFAVGVNSVDAREAFRKYCWFMDEYNWDWDEDHGSWWDYEDEADDTEKWESKDWNADMEEYEFSVSDIKELDFDLKRAECRIQAVPTVKQDKIIVRVNKACSNNVEIGIEEDTLKLDYKKSKENKKVAKIDIYLPAEIVWDKVEMDIGAGIVTAQMPLLANSMDLSVGAGEINIESLKAEQLELEAGAGEISISYVDAKNSKVETGVGSIKLGLAGTKDEYETKIDVAVGSVVFGDEKYEGFANSRENKPKDAWRKMKIDCATGEVHAEFKEVI